MFDPKRGLNFLQSALFVTHVCNKQQHLSQYSSANCQHFITARTTPVARTIDVARRTHAARTTWKIQATWRFRTTELQVQRDT